MAQKKSMLSILLAASTDTLSDTEKKPTSSNNVSAEEAKPGRQLLAAAQGKISTVSHLKVSPSRCKPWSYHNRNIALLNETNEADFLGSIKNQGQQESAKVRKLKDDPDYDYEIICGARRWWACDVLGFELIIEIIHLNDVDAFAYSDADNKDRADVSDYERALEYANVLGPLFNNDRTALATKRNMSEGQLSKYLALATIDKQIINAYSDPRWILVHHAQEIRSATKREKCKKLMLVEAKRLGKLNRAAVGEKTISINGAQVLKLLLAATKERKVSIPVKPIEYQSKTKKKMVTAKVASTGQITYVIHPNSGATKTEVINALKTSLNELLEEK